MGPFRRFEDIEAWQQARGLTRHIYAVSKREAFAKGFGRSGNREFIQFLSTAKGSVAEVRSQLYVAFDEGYIEQRDFEDLQREAEGVSRLIGGLMRHLRQSDYRGTKYR